ncbi:hypothetical protein CAAN1_01S03290 [[Candida] anglica]|uniref:RRM domain-containing protein n=1 Tax=[Candida] anglica TaxID=148631 RepID=A0ABP0EJD4_9ASCO
MSSKPSEFPIVLVKNLPYNTSTDVLFNLFVKYGNIHQLRVPESKSDAPPGTCIVVYSNISNALQACKRINGINFEGRYLVSSMYQVDPSKFIKEDFVSRVNDLKKLKSEYEIE